MMRTLIKALLATLPLAMFLTTTANAAYWECMGPAFACESGRTTTYSNSYKAKRSAYRNQNRSRRTATTSYSGGSSGMASWYGGRFHGRKTANGERYNMNAMTAAHKSLPFGTRVLVTNVRNGRSVEVRINDRGPYVRGRIIDLSRAAASQIGLTASGVAHVRVSVLGRG